MKMREIMNLIDPDKMEVSDFRKIIGRVDDGDNIEDHDDLLQAMYTDHTADERDRLTLEKMRAEIAKLNAAARKDVAAAKRDDQREGSKRKS